MKKRELDNLILNEIFGFGKKKEEDGGEEETSMPGILSKGSPLYDTLVGRASRGDQKALETLLKLDPKEKHWQGSIFDKVSLELEDYEKKIKSKREKGGNPIPFLSQLTALRKIRAGLIGDEKELKELISRAEINRDDDFAKVLSVYGKVFMGDDKPKEPEDKSSTSGEVREVPRGEIKPASGEVREVPRGELTPVSGDQRKPQTKSASAGSSLQIDPKKLTDEEYVSKFAELVKKYMLLEPATEEEAGRQVGKILDFKKQMNDLMKMKQRTPGDNVEAIRQGAIDLQKAIKRDLAPLQRKMQQVVENLVRENFEQIIREELGNYIKEKK